MLVLLDIIIQMEHAILVMIIQLIVTYVIVLSLNHVQNVHKDTIYFITIQLK